MHLQETLIKLEEPEIIDFESQEGYLTGSLG
jgi:hypothetical protein